MSTIPWKPMSQLPSRDFLDPPKRGAKYKLFLTGGENPTGMDHYYEANPDRTHWCYRTDVPGPAKPAKKKPAKKAVKVAKKATKKAANKATSKKYRVA